MVDKDEGSIEEEPLAWMSGWGSNKVRRFQLCLE